MIIFLNGGSSVGKSSIAREIMKQISIPFLYFSIDHLVNYWIDEKFVSISSDENLQAWQKQWFYHVEKKDKNGNLLVKIQDGFQARKLHRNIIRCWGFLAKQDYSLIIDEVVWRKEIFTFYLEEFSNITPIYLIKVTCSLKASNAREKERGDRFIGLANGLKEAEKNMPFYDLEIDTTNVSPQENAKKI